jgi:hypothetical protein
LVQDRPERLERTEFEVYHDLSLGHQLTVRTSGNVEETNEVALRVTGGAFSDVGWHRDRRSPHLGHQAEALVLWEAIGRTVGEDG